MYKNLPEVKNISFAAADRRCGDSSRPSRSRRRRGIASSLLSAAAGGLLSLLFLLAASVPALAQQQKGDPRTHNIFAFDTFRDARVLQTFGRSIHAQANILLKKSTLCYMKGDTVMQAILGNIVGVEIDSVEYRKVNDEQLGRVVARKGYNTLLAVTTINAAKLSAEYNGLENTPYVEWADYGVFLDLDVDAFNFKPGYPLTTKYYFNIGGTIIVANEHEFKKFVRPEMKKAFSRLMNDKWWSWGDEASLIQLFTYLEE